MLALATQNDDLYVAPAAKPKREQAISEPLYSHQPSITLDDPEIAQRFVKEDRGITLRNVRRLCWIAMILIPAAVVLDWFAYPHLIEEFFLWRVMSTLCLISVLFAAHTRWGKRNYRLLTVVVPMIPAFFISLMIRATHDPSSGYYAGLTLPRGLGPDVSLDFHREHRRRDHGPHPLHHCRLRATHAELELCPNR
jgi:hypothetical protein